MPSHGVLVESREMTTVSVKKTSPSHSILTDKKRARLKRFTKELEIDCSRFNENDNSP